MKVTFLGTAGLVPGGLGLKVTGKRGMISMLIDDDYLIDLGDGALRNLNAFGVDLNKIKRIFISHLHSDHFIGIVHVLFSMMNVYNRKDPIEIIGPVGIEKATKGLMSLCELPVSDDKTRGYDLIFREIDTSDKFDDVEAVKGEHPAPAIPYRITRGNKSVFYNSESTFTKEAIELAKGCDLLISTVVVLKPHSFHNSPKEVGEAATEAGAKKVAVVHWPTEFEGRTEKFKELFEPYYEGEVIISEDFTVVDV